MGKIMLLNGSPRAPRSNSKRYAELFASLCPMDSDYFALGSDNHSLLIENLSQYSDLVLVFPLYVDGLPTSLLQFLKTLEAHPPQNKPVVSVLINCGFLEYEQNDVAVRMVQLFCRQNGYEFGSVLRIGSGEAILDTPFKRFVTNSMRKFARSIADWQYDEFQTKMPLPKLLFVKASAQYWDRYGQKNGLSRQDMQSMRIEDN